MDENTGKYIYGSQPFDATCAAGTNGVLIRSGDRIFFRVYGDNHDFVDSDILHDDLSVTISHDALASFYRNGERNVIDHSPSVFQLRKVAD